MTLPSDANFSAADSCFLSEDSAAIDLPQHVDVLPDGRDTLVIGDPVGLSAYNHLQGDNAWGFQNTCGLVCCEAILRQSGVDVTEADLAQYAREHGLCNIEGDLAACGGTHDEAQAWLLRDYGVPAHAETLTSVQELAEYVESGKRCIVEVNQGVLCDDASLYGQGEANHAVVITGVARDPLTHQLQGFFINDSWTDESNKFVDAAVMEASCVDAGGACVVADNVDLSQQRFDPQTMTIGGHWKKVPVYVDGHWTSDDYVWIGD